VSYHAEYSAVGKAHATGKDVTEGRSPHRKLRPDTVGPAPQEPTSLRGRANTARADKPHRLRDRYRCLDAHRLRACWDDLNKATASGVDPVTAERYAVNLQANSAALAQRLKTKRYRAKLVRRCSIPKANGPARPLGRPALDDTLVQRACAKLVTAIYAQDFLEGRDGYRPGRGALEAVRDLTFALQYGRYGSLVEADIQGFFDPRDHAWLLDMLRVRLDERALLKRIRTWLKAGELETDGPVIPPETGTPQGGTVSPVLAHGYLHEALDLGFDTVVKAHCRGEARRSGAIACSPRGGRHATSRWPPSKPPCDGCVVFTPAGSGAAPCWASRASGGQIGTACPASCGVPHARSCKLPANG
jgi:RNA-directed DNA polymerase